MLFQSQKKTLFNHGFGFGGFESGEKKTLMILNAGNWVGEKSPVY